MISMHEKFLEQQIQMIAEAILTAAAADKERFFAMIQDPEQIKSYGKRFSGNYMQISKKLFDQHPDPDALHS